MEDMNLQTSGDFDLITKDQDGNRPAEDGIDNGMGNQLVRENSREMDFVEDEAAPDPVTVSSNGIDNENTSEFVMDITEASNDKLTKSNAIGSNKEQTDKTSDGGNIEVTVTDYESGLKVNKSDVDIKNSGLVDNENYDIPDRGDNEKYSGKVSNTGEECENILSESSNVDDSDKWKLNSEHVKEDGNGSSEKENEFCEINSMPYDDKDVCMNDLNMNDSFGKTEEGLVKETLGNGRRSDDFPSLNVKSPDDMPHNSANDQVIGNDDNLNKPSEFVPSINDDRIVNSSANDRILQEDGSSLKDSSRYREIDESETGKTESHIKDTASTKSDYSQEESSTLYRANYPSSQTSELESSKNYLKNEGNEILTTEIVNCNDESQMELSENEKEAEVNNIDTDLCEDLDKKQDDGDIEDIDIDRNGESDRDSEKKEENNSMKDQDISESEMEKQIISVDENEALIQPGGSEEETITGDTSNEVQINDSRGKDAEICIIPDDVTPRLPATNKEKIVQGDSKSEGENTEGKKMRITSLDMKKDNDENDENNDDGSGETRAVKGATKAAEPKTRSSAQSAFTSAVAFPDSESGSSQVTKSDEINCAQCGQVKSSKFEVIQAGRSNLCSDQCYNAFIKTVQSDNTDGEASSQTRKCSQCHVQVAEDENMLSWETMDFCNEECLGKYQTEMGSNCANCKESVASASLGKYCVRFGYDVKQFCTSACLEEYKKGLKVCSYCQKDMSIGTEGFLAPVGDKGHFKDFCTQSCMEKYEHMSSSTPAPSVIAECAVCSNSKPVKLEVQLENKVQKLCSEPCFAAFKFVNNITEGQCDMCKKYFDRLKTVNFSIYFDDSPHTFCGKTCMNVYILANRKIVPCNWCKVKKYNFDMIKKVCVTGQVLMMCSLNCLALYQVSVNAVASRRIRCDFCTNFAPAKYHLTMSDATVRNFCSYTCVMSFQNQYPKQTLSLPAAERLTTPIPTGGPKKILPRRSQVETSGVPVISSVQSLASPNGPVAATRVSIPASEMSLVPQVASISQPITIQQAAIPTPPPPQVYQQIITKPAPVKQQKNKSVLCKPYSHTKGVSCRPHPCMKETQTDESLNRKFLIPVPVPIYVPAPMHMFATPFPVAVPFPLPIPVPIFIPTTRNSAKGILKEIKRIQEKIPTDPFEAELLMMAEMVAGEKKQDPTDSESEDGNDGDDGGDGTFSPENVDTSNTFGDDMLQMALKMATELEEPPVDMESVLTSNTITPTSQPSVDPSKGLYGFNADDPDQVQVMPMNRGRKRSMRGGRNSAGGNQSKRGRRISGSNVDVPILPPPEPAPPPRIEVEKPDANFCLKYTFGVNAWRHWVMQKNAELEKAALTNRKIKLFKPELLQLTADELNFSLCLFVKEVRKPNGTEYAPDTIYYLCLGIQQYLFENGRIDNIFTDSYYEKFTDCLDEVAKKFAALYSDSQYIVTRVEEEHLWESKQLGAHSPHVLLSTLMFFNTKHFNLVTVEEHMQLSFSHIMKHWKRNPNAPGIAKVPGSRNVLLRFYPPQSALEANSRKKKVYEQQENEENPLRCPVKLYEFYLSKCPESVKTRNDVFYLLPERSCVPDSPVWYSTMALGKEPLTKMLHRVKMVKEINIALLSC